MPIFVKTKFCLRVFERILAFTELMSADTIMSAMMVGIRTFLIWRETIWKMTAINGNSRWTCKSKFWSVGLLDAVCVANVADDNVKFIMKHKRTIRRRSLVMVVSVW